MIDTIYLLVGPVGVGKSTALEVAEEKELATMEMGAVAREMHAEADTDLSVSEWAGQMREQEGETFLIEEVLDRAPTGGDIVIDGVRDPAEIEYVREYSRAYVCVVLLWANQLERFHRLDRDKEYAQNFGAFLTRDAREIQWGIDDIIRDEQYDYWIANEGEFAWYLSVLRKLFEDNLRGETYITP